ncbi:MAG: hypothetical protein PVG93_00205 [Phycisphaerales bacterium]
MSKIDAEAQVMSEDTETGDEALSDNAKLVAESVRYHKRAQNAERKVEELTERLNHARTETASLTEQLDKTKIEQKLIRKLASAGAVDLETVLLVAKTRVDAGGEADLDGVIEQLKREKAYLFAEQKNDDATAAKKTASVKDRLASNSSALERTAKRAAASGSATDLQQYLKLRRNYV